MSDHEQSWEEQYCGEFEKHSANSAFKDFLESHGDMLSTDHVIALIELDARLCGEAGYVLTVERYFEAVEQLRGCLTVHRSGEQPQSMGTEVLEKLLHTVLRCVLDAVDPERTARESIAGYLQMIRDGYPQTVPVIPRVYEEMYGIDPDDEGLESRGPRTDLDGVEDEEVNSCSTDPKLTQATWHRDGRPKSIGEYVIVEPLGKGGAGQVHHARKKGTGESVAIKLFFDLAMDPAMRERMCEREFSALKSLRHDSIVGVIESGIIKSSIPSMVMPYLVLDYIEQGRRIDQYCSENPLKRHDRIKKFRSLCEVIQYAHDRNCTHGDLSTNNVLIDQHGKLHVIDFGLSSRLRELVGGDLHDARLEYWGGTRGFRAPQTYGHSELAKREHWDIYSLGVILCVLLTGEKPFDLEGIEDDSLIVDKLLHDQPNVSTGLSPELRSIIICAIQRAPEYRYGSVRELAADIQRYQHGQMVNAMDPTPWYLFRRFCSQHVLVALLILFMVLGLIGVSVQSLRLSQQVRLDRKAKADFQSLLGVVGNHLASDAVVERIPSKQFFEWVPEEDTPDGFGRAIVLSYSAELADNTLAVYDRKGHILARPSSPFEVPPVVSTLFPRDPESRIVGGLVADVLKELPGDELVLLQQHRRMFPAVLRIYRLDQLDKPVRETWHQGQWNSVHWNEQAGLLTLVAASNKLADYCPEIDAWDSAWAKSNEQYLHPMVIIVLDPEELPEYSVLPPTPTTAQWPPAPIKGMFTLKHIATPPDTDIYGIQLRYAEDPSEGFVQYGGLVDLVILYTRDANGRYTDFFARRTIDTEGRWLNEWHSKTKSVQKRGVLLPQSLERIDTDEMVRIQIELGGRLEKLHDPLLVRELVREEGVQLSEGAQQVIQSRSQSARWLYGRAKSIAMGRDSSAEQYNLAVELAERAERLLPENPRAGLDFSVRCVRFMALVRAHRSGASSGEGVGDLLLRCDQLTQEADAGTLWAQRLYGFRAILLWETGDQSGARDAYVQMRDTANGLGWIGMEEDARDVALLEEIKRLTALN